MSDPSKANSTLYRFLDASRRRMELWNALSAAGIAITAVAVLTCPLVARRASLGLRDSVLAIGITLAAVSVFAVLAMRRGVHLQQVPDRLDTGIDDRDRVATATEFMGDADPFKKLAVHQTERWIDQEQERLSHLKGRRWPYIGMASLLLLVLIWLLTPGLGRSSPRTDKSLASAVPPPSAVTQPSATSNGSQTNTSQSPISTNQRSSANKANVGTRAQGNSGASSGSTNTRTSPAGQSSGTKPGPAANSASGSLGSSASGRGGTVSSTPGSLSSGSSGSVQSSPSKNNGNAGAISASPGGGGGTGSLAQGTGIQPQNPVAHQPGSSGSAAGSGPGAKSRGNANASSGVNASSVALNAGNVGSAPNPGGSASSGDPSNSALKGEKTTPSQAVGTLQEDDTPAQGMQTLVPGGSGHGQAGESNLRIRTGAVPSAPVVAVDAAKARPSNTLKERESTGEIDDSATGARAAASPDIHFDPIEIETSELEALPPRRRQVVIEYFRSMNRHSASASTTQPAEGVSHP
jgi:hypothetical protein